MTPQELGIRVAHIGINTESPEEAEKYAQVFCNMLGLPMQTTPVSHMAGFVVEVMNSNSRGKNGHIGIHCDNIEAAEPFFESLGFTIDGSTRRTNPDGSTFLVYLNEEIAGFAIHLTLEG